MPLEIAANAQRLAAHPHHSAWVAASAGSGKTKVLTDRVLNLLLEGCDPERILCLTFTKAAAAEMANRVRVRLGEWAILPEPELRQSLENLQGFPPSDEKLARARTLFGLALDTPGGLKIQTIHSFCQSLLKRFPLEAGLSPFFEVMNDTERQRLLKTASHQVLEDPRHREFAVRFSEVTLGELSEVVLQSSPLRGEGPITRPSDDLSHKGRGILTSATPYAHYERKCLIMGKDTSPLVGEVELLRAERSKRAGEGYLTLLHALITSIPTNALKRHLSLFEEGSASDQARGQKLAQFLVLTEEEKIERYEDYVSIFLTQKGERRACVLTQKAAKNAPEFKDLLEEEGTRVEQWLNAYHTWEVAHMSQMIHDYGLAFLETYETLKKTKSLLDYEDLILKTADLLKNPGCHWVLYKLDGGLDHILVDEAQDTSPTQWQVIRAIAEEFYANSVGDPRNRTLFIVGDGKQSIYSFQGADPAVFTQMQQDLSTFARNSGQTWKDIDLTVSFRSTPQVLAVVDAVFSHCPLVSHPLEHLPFRKESAGHVEVWPLIEEEKEEPLESWRPPVTQRHTDSPQRKLARLMAKTIRGWLSGQGPLSRPVAPGDILILVRRRTAFVDTLIRALKEQDVPVAGIDRLWLLESLAVQDLLKIGEFLLLPEDDLTLATVLKGPLCGLTDEDLLKVVSPKRKSSSRNLENLSDNLGFLNIRDPGLQNSDPKISGFRILSAPNPSPDFIRGSGRSAKFRDDDTGAAGTPLSGIGEILPTAGEGYNNLWKRLQNDPTYMEVTSLLNNLLSQVDYLTPFALFSMILGPLQGKKKWQSRLGPECLDSIDEFLSLCLNFQEDHTPSLQGFLHWVSQEIIELKRDLDQSNQVRIMTVHGSKGLQAPIVFLPDTTQIPADLPPFDFHDSRLVWLPPAIKDIPLTKELKQKLREKQQEEYNRLLYVALTRAEDALYVCGWQGSAQNTWYDLVTEGMKKIGEETEFEGLPGTGWRLSTAQKNEVFPAPSEKHPIFLSPAWLTTPPPAETFPQVLRPSDEGDDSVHPSTPVPPLHSGTYAQEERNREDPAAPFVQSVDPEGIRVEGYDAASANNGYCSTRRGILIHRLLETMVSVPQESRARLALRYLEKEQVPSDVALEMIESVTQVFDAYPDLFGPRSQGEVPIVGRVGEFALSGQIDRLIVLEDHILCVDFKTHAHVPAGLEDIPQTYIRQMALYQFALSQIYPQVPILCGLLWTHLPRLDLLPDELLKKFTPSIDEKVGYQYTKES